MRCGGGSGIGAVDGKLVLFDNGARCLKNAPGCLLAWQLLSKGAKPARGENAGVAAAGQKGQKGIFVRLVGAMGSCKGLLHKTMDVGFLSGVQPGSEQLLEKLPFGAGAAEAFCRGPARKACVQKKAQEKIVDMGVGRKEPGVDVGQAHGVAYFCLDIVNAAPFEGSAKRAVKRRSMDGVEYQRPFGVDGQKVAGIFKRGSADDSGADGVRVGQRIAFAENVFDRFLVGHVVFAQKRQGKEARALAGD